MSVCLVIGLSSHTVQTKQCLLEQLDEKDKQLNILQGMLDDTMLRVTHTQPTPQMGMMCA